MKRRIKHVLLTLLCSAVLGTVLLIGIFLLPVENARAHVVDSLYDMIYVAYDANGSVSRQRTISMKDNFTDDLMVQNALERVTGKSALEQAMYIYHYDLGDDTTWLTEESLLWLLEAGEQDMELREYSKYWHGYLVWLKPLLLCMSWSRLETFLMILQMGVLLFLLAFSVYKRQLGAGICLVIAYLYMKPAGVLHSLTLSACWWIVLFAVFCMLCLEARLEQKMLWEEVFLLIGVLTAYFDFLTYPIVTLGVPLCIYLVLHVEKQQSIRSRISSFFWLCAEWVIGYIGMWGLKWVIAELTCHSETLRSAVWSVIYRTGPLDGYGSAFTGISRTIRDLLRQYDAAVYGIGLALIVAAAVVSVLWCLVRARNTDWSMTVLGLVCVGLFPFLWLSLTQNHTAIHSIFTFRIMAVTIMALCCITLCSVRTVLRRKGILKRKS